VVDHIHTKGRVRECTVLSPFQVSVLAPFLISACFLLMLLLICGKLKLLALIGLSGWVLPVAGVGFLAALPLGFLKAVRIGQFLLGRRDAERNG